MNIKKVKTIFIFLLLAFAGLQGSAQGKKNLPAFIRIEGYRPKLNAHQGEDLATHLFSSKKQFDALFEKKPASRADKISFENRAVVACLGSKNSPEARLSLEKINKKDGVLEVYFKADYEKKQGAGSAPFCLYNILVDRSLSGINYYINGKLTEELRN
jgi:hypothetical protein